MLQRTILPCEVNISDVNSHWPPYIIYILPSLLTMNTYLCNKRFNGCSDNITFEPFQAPPLTQMFVFYVSKENATYVIIISYFQCNAILTFCSTFDWNICLDQTHIFRNNKMMKKKLWSGCNHSLIST